MKKIINTYNKRLTFPSLDFSIEPNEIKIISESDFINLIPNLWLKEIVPETQKKKVEKIKEKLKIKKQKGRNK